MIYGLETLRGLAALAVAFYHYPSESLLFIQKGHMAVYLFFSLSGFVITLNYFRKIYNLNSLINFQSKRFFRLYPVHLFVLILVLLIQCLKYVLIELGFPAGSEAFTGNPDMESKGTSWYSLKNFILHIFLLQAVVDYGYWLSWNGAAWTISTEFYTYFVFGLLVLISLRKSYLFITLIIIYLIFNQNIFDFIDIFLNLKLHRVFQACMVYFFTGSLMFFIYEKLKFRINDFIFFGLLFICIYFKNYLSNHTLFSILILLVALLKDSSFSYILLNNKILVYLGTISYSFYMIHQVVIYVFIQILKIFNLGYSFSENFSGATGSVFYDTIITISYTSISIIIAIYMHRYIENKFRIKKSINSN